MTTSLFNKYLKDLDEKMKKQQRHIILLVDNAPVHIVDDGTTLNYVLK